MCYLLHESAAKIDRELTSGKSDFAARNDSQVSENHRAIVYKEIKNIFFKCKRMEGCYSKKYVNKVGMVMINDHVKPSLHLSLNNDSPQFSNNRSEFFCVCR